MNKQKAPTCLT